MCVNFSVAPSILEDFEYGKVKNDTVFDKISCYSTTEQLS